MLFHRHSLQTLRDGSQGYLTPSWVGRVQKGILGGYSLKPLNLSVFLESLPSDPPYYFSSTNTVYTGLMGAAGILDTGPMGGLCMEGATA